MYEDAVFRFWIRELVQIHCPAIAANLNMKMHVNMLNWTWLVYFRSAKCMRYLSHTCCDVSNANYNLIRVWYFLPYVTCAQ